MKIFNIEYLQETFLKKELYRREGKTTKKLFELFLSLTVNENTHFFFYCKTMTLCEITMKQFIELFEFFKNIYKVEENIEIIRKNTLKFKDNFIYFCILKDDFSTRGYNKIIEFFDLE